jgi:hypothetical protein
MYTGVTQSSVHIPVYTMNNMYSRVPDTQYGTGQTGFV